MSSILKVDQLQDSGGNALITSDGSGNLTASAVTNTPAFRATVNADQTVADSTWTKINFDVIDYDTHSAYSTANKRFTVPTGHGGKYLFTAGANFYLDDTRRIGIRLYVNGAQRQHGRTDFESASANSFMCATSTFIVELSVGDYVEAYTIQANGNSRGLNKAYNEFTGQKLIGV